MLKPKLLQASGPFSIKKLEATVAFTKSDLKTRIKE